MTKVQIKKAAVIGAGPAGLTFACFLASRNVRTFLYEQDSGKRKGLSDGVTHFYEPELRSMLSRCLKSGRLRVAASTKDAVGEADVTFVSVNTPTSPKGAINLSYIKRSCVEIGKALAKLKRFHIVVVRSTIVPGTTTHVLQPLLERHSGKVSGKGFGLAVQPEFLREGKAIWDLAHPSRIVIGSNDEKTREALVSLCRRMYANANPPIIVGTPATAEMIKYASNCFLATKISFINEIANISERLGEIDMPVVAQGVGLDPRIGPENLKAGIGYGGACLPKDIDALVFRAKMFHYKPALLESVRWINQSQPKQIVEIVRKQLGTLRGRKASILGLAFKPDTDDVRDSPSIALAQTLVQKGCRVSVFDPQALQNARKILGTRVTYSRDEFDCVSGSDCCFVCTPWKRFESLDFVRLATLMRKPLLVDCKMTYDFRNLPAEVTYIGLGRARPATTTRGRK